MFSDFVKLLDYLLQQAKAKALDTDTNEGGTLEQIQTILVRLLMFTIVSKLEASGMIAASKLDISMFFSETEKEECSVNKYPQPKDQKNISSNKRKFSEQKQNVAGTISGNKSSRSDDSSINK